MKKIEEQIKGFWKDSGQEWCGQHMTLKQSNDHLGFNLCLNDRVKAIEQYVIKAKIESLQELIVDIPGSFKQNAKEILRACNDRIELRIVELGKD